jgi:hypothetical protein
MPPFVLQEMDLAIRSVALLMGRWKPPSAQDRITPGDTQRVRDLFLGSYNAARDLIEGAPLKLLMLKLVVRTLPTLLDGFESKPVSLVEILQEFGTAMEELSTPPATAARPLPGPAAQVCRHKFLFQVYITTKQVFVKVTYKPSRLHTICIVRHTMHNTHIVSPATGTHSQRPPASDVRTNCPHRYSPQSSACCDTCRSGITQRDSTNAETCFRHT